MTKYLQEINKLVYYIKIHVIMVVTFDYFK
jgi:hypothetical protein